MTMQAMSELYRALPSVGDFLASPGGRECAGRFGEGVVKLELRALLEEVRGEIGRGEVTCAVEITELARRLREKLARLMLPAGRRAVNATGILLHTGLGRAPLCERAAEALTAGAGYTVLQASLDKGDRSLREERAERLLIELTGAEAATVVNNNAAATMLVLHALAAGKEVIISRGQLIEIGGAFRMPDVMAQSGAIMREVGTTNRTHLRDYEAAVTPNTGAIIHVHTSNYRVRGFASTPEVGELVTLGRKFGVPVIDDLGSGALVDLSKYGLTNEPLVRDSIAGGKGADVACFSSDKLICGPQSGLICGKRAWIEKIRKDPFARMFRVCKLTLAALEATLLEFVNGDYERSLPFYRMLARPIADVAREADELAGRLRGLPELTVQVEDDVAYVGSGSLPDEGIKSTVVCVSHRTLDGAELGRRLRHHVPAVFGRLRDRTLILDARTLRPGDLEVVVAAVKAAVSPGEGA